MEAPHGVDISKEFVELFPAASVTCVLPPIPSSPSDHHKTLETLGK
jgi:hypothetical protein